MDLRLTMLAPIVSNMLEAPNDRVRAYRKRLGCMRLDRNVTVVGAHAEGEVGRVITGGVLAPQGATMFERMTTLERESRWLRDMLLFDPRGSVNAAVNLITPPADSTAAFGMIVME